MIADLMRPGSRPGQSLGSRASIVPKKGLVERFVSVSIWEDFWRLCAELDAEFYVKTKRFGVKVERNASP